MQSISVPADYSANCYRNTIIKSHNSDKLLSFFSFCEDKKNTLNPLTVNTVLVMSQQRKYYSALSFFFLIFETKPLPINNSDHCQCQQQ